ncbi:MAG TPA: hypothetical protein VFN67_10200 [Polyangiales bacterium]|nr:hypothetical protein [Polyangiales bacterium]
MTKRLVRELLGLFAVLLPGAIGAVVVAKTFSTYWGRDAQASVIVFVIGVALLIGLAELVARQLRAARLETEVTALPAHPNESTLDVLGAQLGSLLRARLENQPSPSLGESMAPFLTGLLVMLGLLGTLLGLFQTVHGAGHALTSASDVDALRRSLATPIAGLTRSFGCSAAGISASAMLGLSLALVRRRESRLLRAIHAYAAGPLRMHSPLRRQARALEQLANQGNVLPAAATALEGVSQKLGELSGQVIALQTNALEAQQEAFGELLASLRAELTRSAADSGEQLVSKLGPLLTQVAERSAEALTSQADAFAGVARELRTELSQDASERRKETSEALHSLRTQLDDAERARAAAHSAELDKLATLASQSLNEAERRERELAERWQQQLSRLDGQLEAVQTGEAERLRSLDAQLTHLRERDDSSRSDLDALTARVGSELTRLVGALDAQIEGRSNLEREHAEHTLRAAQQLTAAATTLESQAGKQQATLEQTAVEQKATFTRLVEQLPGMFEQAARSSHDSAQAAMAQLKQLTEQQLTQISQILSEDVATRAAAESNMVERAKSAFDHAERQSAEVSQLLERVHELLPQLTDAAQAGAAQTLARLNELVEAQAERYASFEAALQEARHEQAGALATQLTEHANELEQRLARAVNAVQEAAAVWQASSAEMHAVASSFASSIERQREASDAWIESLGDVEGAVERAGQNAAHDALSDQLASTQEVFAKQLQFQRELFEQLRALRPSPSGSRVSANQGEADVSI